MKSVLTIGAHVLIAVVLMAVVLRSVLKSRRLRKFQRKPRMRVHMHSERRHEIIGDWPHIDHEPRGA